MSLHAPPSLHEAEVERHYARDPATLEHPVVRGLFPCGEGAGYAGGIVSAAMDGERVAEAIAGSF